MTQVDLEKMSAEELLLRFAEITIEQDKAIFDENNRKYNRLFDRMMKIQNELQSRPGDQRRALVALHGHRNIQVRLMAAFATREVAPSLTRPVFEAIANSGCYPQAADARSALAKLDGRPIVP